MGSYWNKNFKTIFSSTVVQFFATKLLYGLLVGVSTKAWLGIFKFLNLAKMIENLSFTL